MSFIDLMGNVVWTDEQMDRYCERLVLRQFNERRRRQLDDMITGSLLGRYTPTTEEAAEIEAYGDLRFAVREQRLKAVADNAKLAGAIAYEQAVRQKAELELRINGRDAVDEVPEETDQDTGEVTQAYVKAEPAIEPLATTIDQDGETVNNPAYVQAVDDLAAAQAMIDGAAAEVVSLVVERAL
jgi:hypothetical protein